jgi:hypothetical protein
MVQAARQSELGDLTGGGVPAEHAARGAIRQHDAALGVEVEHAVDHRVEDLSQVTRLSGRTFHTASPGPRHP